MNYSAHTFNSYECLLHNLIYKFFQRTEQSTKCTSFVEANAALGVL